ncbi:hypothetical protein MtrunA17_Chr3g0107601 [Medicago truncatula]|uniref:Uncharacterized protein n=1 Tax=Medicago truncatula TaxID=3880 RepID=A0A396IQ74_MEDTR|nr:hypothetical protein MtrunA17_Chr3g0107601 [Medicago truncatula]
MAKVVVVFSICSFQWEHCAYALVEVFGYFGHLCRFGYKAFCECNFEEQFSCCMMLPGFLVGFYCSLGGVVCEQRNVMVDVVFVATCDDV